MLYRKITLINLKQICTSKDRLLLFQPRVRPGQRRDYVKAFVFFCNNFPGSYRHIGYSLLDEPETVP